MNQPSTTLPPRRVTVVSPRAQADVSLPAQAMIADVVSQLSSLVSGGRDSSATAEAPPVDPSGWVLTTLLGATLDDEQTVAQVGLRDGDLLYLHPRTPALPEPLFDDVVDAVALTTGTRHRWGPEQTRAAALAAGAAVSAAGIPLLVLTGPSRGTAIAAGLLAALLLGASALFGRVLQRDVPAVVSLALAVAYSALAGASALVGLATPVGSPPPADSGEPVLLLLGPPQLLLGGVLALATGLMGLLTVPGRGPVVAFVTAIAGSAAMLAAVTVLFDLEAARVAGVGAVVLVLSAPSWPTAALRLGRVPMPRIPRDVSDFTELTSTDEGRDTVGAARDSGRYLVALLLAFGLVVGVCAFVVLGQGGLWATFLSIALALAVLARARHLRATVAKSSALAVGAFAALLVVTGLVAGGEPSLVILLIVVAVAGVAVAALLIERMPVRRPSPHRARALDVLEILTLVALIPLLFGVLDLYVLLRGIGG